MFLHLFWRTSANGWSIYTFFCSCEVFSCEGLRTVSMVLAMNEFLITIYDCLTRWLYFISKRSHSSDNPPVWLLFCLLLWRSFYETNVKPANYGALHPSVSFLWLNINGTTPKILPAHTYFSIYNCYAK